MSDHIYKCISESYQNSFFDFLNLKLGAQKKKQLLFSRLHENESI